MFQIDPFSTATLQLEVFAGGAEPWSTGTGLLIICQGRPFFVTNWHLATGRHPLTEQLNEAGAIPQTFRIFHRCVDNASLHLGVKPMDEPLLTGNNQPRWFELPNRRLSDQEDPNLAVDVVLLPLQQTAGCVINQGFYWASFNVEPYVEPGSEVSVVGYPRGLMGVKNYPIWKTAHIASDIQGHPDQKHFLIDGTTREGMSGSPVVARNRISPFMGIYSGRLPDDVEIGIVWRSIIVHQLLEQAFGHALFR